MPLKRDEDNFGLEAFRSAIQRQEGTFMRAATVIGNAPKDLYNEVETDNNKVADALMKRNPLGQFAKKE